MSRRDLDIDAYGAQNRERLRKLAQSPLTGYDEQVRAVLKAVSDQSHEREEETQAAIIAHFRAEPGIRLLQASVRYRMVKCPACDHVFHNHADTGQSPGVPDLLIHADTWALPIFLGCEVKGASTRLSKAQQELHAAGAIVVARTVAQAVAHKTAIDEALRRCGD